MIDVLGKLDNRTAAGILARAAIALENEGNPAASKIVEGEAAIRDALFREARSRLGFEVDDFRPETIEKVGDFLDEEADRLIEPPDTNSALERMAQRGTLASDLYQINIIPLISQFHGRIFDVEKHLIERTIRSPDREQHFGPSLEISKEPSLISLFARQFKTPWPFKDFVMLVGAQRDKLILNVHQAWRLYASIVDVRWPPLAVTACSAFGGPLEGVYEVDIGQNQGLLFKMS